MFQKLEEKLIENLIKNHKDLKKIKLFILKC